MTTVKELMDEHERLVQDPPNLRDFYPDGAAFYRAVDEYNERKKELIRKATELRLAELTQRRKEDR